ncbi:MAG: NifU family protein [Erysipelotrichaceae bacterium]|nr:NifU family protein [Erysipelotrichaceae bacterium]
MENEEKIALVKKTIEKIRPYILNDGGDVEFVSLEDDIVYVNVLGACVGCGALEFTLRDGIAALILDEVPGIKDVQLANPSPSPFDTL